MEAISIEKKREEKNHVKLIANEKLRLVISNAIEDSFNKALAKAKKDDDFVADGESALMAIETKVFDDFSQAAVRNLFNNLSQGIGNIINKISKR